MKKTLITILTVLAIVSSTLIANGTKEDTNPNAYKVGVSKLLPHPALDAAEQGMKDYLESTDLEITFDFQNANGDISTAASIASQLKAGKVDVAVGIATPSAQSLANTMGDTPVVFTAVTDPVSAQLVGPTICGVSDETPVKSQIELLIQITGAKSIGNVYTSGEANGVILNEMVQEACDELGIKCVSAAVSNTSEVKMAAQSIIDRVDAMYIAPDNAVYSAFSSVSDVCADNGIPLMGSDPTGTTPFEYLVAWGFNYYNIGVATGKLVEQCLTGATPGDLGTVLLTDAKDFELWVNLDNAKKLGIDVDQSILDKATYIVENGNAVKQN